MNILVVSPALHYLDHSILEPGLEWSLGPLRRMGHTVRLYNMNRWHPIDRDWMNEEFLALLSTGRFDLVLIGAWDRFERETLTEAMRHATTITFNPDDDSQWHETGPVAPYFSYMFTFSRPVYEANKAAVTNLRLTQWACTGTYDGLDHAKDIPVSFVGQLYGNRAKLLQQLRRVSKVTSYGPGFGGSVGDRTGYSWRWRRLVTRVLSVPLVEPGLSYEAMNAIWNRTRVSFCPMEASRGNVLQMKARVFEMGMSGTLMLCNRYAPMDEYYERGKEYDDFETIEECKSKVKFYLKHEEARRKIALAYHARTKGEHLWEHRYEKLLAECGLPAHGNGML